MEFNHFIFIFHYFPHRYVEALCALVSMTPEQLSFKQGQRMKVIRNVDDDLLLCSFDNQEGLVHSACVKEVIHTA